MSRSAGHGFGSWLVMAVANTCSVCASADRPAIDEALVASRPYREIAAQHALTISSLSRHRRSHVSEALKALQVEISVAGPRSALSRFEALYDEATAILAALKSEGNASKSLVAIQTLSGVITQIAKLTGELDERSQVQVVNLQTSAEWLQARAVILGALDKHPVAKADVIRAIGGAS